MLSSTCSLCDVFKCEAVFFLEYMYMVYILNWLHCVCACVGFESVFFFYSQPCFVFQENQIEAMEYLLAHGANVNGVATVKAC